MCYAVAFVTRPLPKGLTLLIHKTRPLQEHSHTAILISWGIPSKNHHLWAKWEYRPGAHHVFEDNDHGFTRKISNREYNFAQKWGRKLRDHYVKYDRSTDRNLRPLRPWRLLHPWTKGVSYYRSNLPSDRVIYFLHKSGSYWTAWNPNYIHPKLRRKYSALLKKHGIIIPSCSTLISATAAKDIVTSLYTYARKHHPRLAVPPQKKAPKIPLPRNHSVL